MKNEGIHEVAARLAGYRGATAFAQFAALLSQEQLEAVGAFWSPSKKRYTAPAVTTFHNILAARPPETLCQATLKTDPYDQLVIRVSMTSTTL